MNAYILAAGPGERIAPYGECRPKTLLPIANKPLLEYLCDGLDRVGVDNVVIAAGPGESDIRKLVASRPGVTVTRVGKTTGSAVSLLEALEDDAEAMVLYGDVYLSDEDLKSLAGAVSPDRASLLLAPIPETASRDWISVTVKDDVVSSIVGHPREGATHRVAGVAVPAGFRKWLENCPTHFPSVEVGMMPPAEHHIEAAVETYRAEGSPVYAITATAPTIDLDKPWHILEANFFMAKSVCSGLGANDLAEGATIDDTASIDGFVKLGRNSRIGRNVIVRGNIVVGDGTEIDAGAIIGANVVIGSNCFVGNACYIAEGSVVGDECVVSHAAELDGTIFRRVYLYHYMEIYGIVGENTDIGAGTVCGSLRFDDGATVHKVRSRRELPDNFSNATYIGDYCRTGVNATIMPGKKIGPYSVVGAGVLLEKDLPPRTGVRARQEQETFRWGPERYGW